MRKNGVVEKEEARGVELNGGSNNIIIKLE
jgi:hypothetical protein